MTKIFIFINLYKKIIFKITKIEILNMLSEFDFEQLKASKTCIYCFLKNYCGKLKIV